MPAHGRAAALACLMLLGGLAGCTSSPPVTPTGPVADAPARGNPVVLLDTAKGLVAIELYQRAAPQTVANFVNLTTAGYYDGVRFHRILGPAKMPPVGFMIQGGDAYSKDTAMRGQWGNATVNFTLQDEIPRDKNGFLVLRHDAAGVVSMANRGAPNTANVQFFITLEPAPWLDGYYTIFGHVIGGLQAVKAIGNVTTDAQDKPLDADAVLIHKATLLQGASALP